VGGSVADETWLEITVHTQVRSKYRQPNTTPLTHHQQQTTNIRTPTKATAMPSARAIAPPLRAHTSAVLSGVVLTRRSFATCGADGLVVVWRDGLAADRARAMVLTVCLFVCLFVCLLIFVDLGRE
jgi:hypothetical protein